MSTQLVLSVIINKQTRCEVVPWWYHGHGKESLTETSRPGFISTVRPDLPQSETSRPGFTGFISTVRPDEVRGRSGLTVEIKPGLLVSVRLSFPVHSHDHGLPNPGNH